MALKNCQGVGEGLGVDMINIKRLVLCDMYYPPTINDSLQKAGLLTQNKDATDPESTVTGTVQTTY